MINMDKEIANKVYDVLVSIGGATESYRDSFIHHHTPPNSCDEWRFGGKLGFGGKYRSRYNTVDCYSEDETTERKNLIKKLNEALSLIF